jgi:hypothetical protein
VCALACVLQEPVALKAINAAAVNGTWVLLQNCELGLPLMDQMEDVLLGMRETVNAEFRLFITCLPHYKFPLALLQMCTKITNEPPQGTCRVVAGWSLVVGSWSLVAAQCVCVCVSARRCPLLAPS